MNFLLELTRIVQAVALAKTPGEQVRLIVESIQRAMSVDICSLYMSLDNGDMQLVASQGLAAGAVGHSRLKAGQGLVGLVAADHHPINIARAGEHPAYVHLPETQEDTSFSFCGVPLVRTGRCTGVLVVQSRQTRPLSEEEEAFLVTLATQLALVVPDHFARQVADNNRQQGIKGAPGIGIGSAHICDHIDLSSVTDGRCEDIAEALDQWRQLLIRVRKDLEAERLALGEGLPQSVASIFSAYQMLLDDPALTEKVETAIKDGHWLPGALRQVIRYYADMFLAIEDPYLQTRHEDIWHLGNKLFNAWTGSVKKAPTAAQDAWVLVGNQVSVSDIAAVPRNALAGVVCFAGSNLSHTAILAKALGIPAVMGTGFRAGLSEQDTLIVDGNEGMILINPKSSVLKEYRRLVAEERQLEKNLKHLRDQQAITTDGQRVRLFANTGLQADLTPSLENGAEGIGLYRTEIPFMVSDGFPLEDEQEHIYRQAMTAFPDKPVYMRTLDIGGDKPLPYFPIHEDNPALGWRGIRFSLDNNQLLMTQLRAMLRAADGSEHLHILLPMVSATRELTAFHTLLDEACQQLKAEGVRVTRPRVGIMVEVPAAISQLPFWKPWLDFISIGSNDLSQYLLALDRNNTQVSATYDVVHPAVLHEISRIVRSAQALELPVSLCGEMASDPVAVVLLIGLGIRALSMSAAQLPRIKWLILSLSVTQAEALATEALTLASGDDIRERVNEVLNTLDLQALIPRKSSR